MPGRFPLFTDENIPGPLIEGLIWAGWDLVRVIEVYGQHSIDARVFEHAVGQGRVLVSTDTDCLVIANRWLTEPRPFRLVYWHQRFRGFHRIPQTHVLKRAHVPAQQLLASLSSLDDLRTPALELPSPPTAFERLEQREQEREACGAFCAAGEPRKRTQDAWGNYRFPAELEDSQNRFGFTGHYWDRGSLASLGRDVASKVAAPAEDKLGPGAGRLLGGEG